MDADGNNREKLEDQAMGYIMVSAMENRLHSPVLRETGTMKFTVLGVGGQEAIRKVTQSIAIVGKWMPIVLLPMDGGLHTWSEHKGFYHIYVVDSDGRNLHRLTHNEENHWAPAWSPNDAIQL